MKALLSLLSMVLVLSSCGGADVKNRLKGDRIDIFAQEITGLETIPRTQEIVSLVKSRPNQFWTQKGKDARHSGGNLALDIPLSVLWQRDIGQGGKHHILSTPIVAERSLLIIDASQELIALDAFTGDELWSYELEDPNPEDFSIGLAYHNGLVVAITPNGFISVHRLQDGSVLWTKNLEKPVRASPTISNGQIYIMTLNNRLLALDVETGRSLWQDSSLARELGFLGSASPAVDIKRNFVVAAYSSEEVHTLSSDNGQIFWQSQLPRAQRSGIANPMEDVTAEPVISPDRIFVLSYGGGLSALNVKNGATIWHRPIQSSLMPWQAGNALFIITSDNQLVALNKDDGTLFWSVRLPAFIDEEEKDTPLQWYGPIIGSGFVLTVSSESDVRFHSAFSGEFKKSINLDATITLNPIIANGILYLLTDNAEIIALR